MNSNRGLRFLPLLVTLLIIAVVIAAIVSIGRAVLGGNSTSTTENDTSAQMLLNTNDDRAVAMIVRGPIVAQENFRSYKIEVTPFSRSMEVYRGYLDTREKGTDLSNNTKAYEEFVNALDKANMTDTRSGDISNNLLGICATGYVYEFELLQDGDVTKKIWTSSCSGSKGNMAASKDQVASLFLEQIPNSGDLVPFTSTNSLSF